ncbi:soluble lytic murein transglycosylase-like protein [Herbaspirillum sp. Sphag1AN]|nr:lytic transglycosylase domain-containing protein [Herbaspirillum sp. Sphag1AN]MBB3211518.1 soluble lytic murein transglycosylase-like protein [Herbaspirillum sp. Sphag1AN]
MVILLAMTNVHARCFDEAGKKHAIDPLLLEAIAYVESSMNPKAVNVNRNGTQDIGLMQINSSHLQRLEKQGVTRELLLSDSCLSVMVGAEILAQFIARFGYTWRAVGAYNAGAGLGKQRDELRDRYAQKVVKQYQILKAKPLRLAGTGK